MVHICIRYNCTTYVYIVQFDCKSRVQFNIVHMYKKRHFFPNLKKCVLSLRENVHPVYFFLISDHPVFMQITGVQLYYL